MDKLTQSYIEETIQRLLQVIIDYLISQCNQHQQLQLQQQAAVSRQTSATPDTLSSSSPCPLSLTNSVNGSLLRSAVNHIRTTPNASQLHLDPEDVLEQSMASSSSSSASSSHHHQHHNHHHHDNNNNNNHQTNLLNHHQIISNNNGGISSSSSNSSGNSGNNNNIAINHHHHHQQLSHHHLSRHNNHHHHHHNHSINDTDNSNSNNQNNNDRHHSHHNNNHQTSNNNGNIINNTTGTGEGSKLKRSRTFIDPMTEVPLLESWFRENSHPDSSKIEEFTTYLNSLPYRSRVPQLEGRNLVFCSVSQLPTEWTETMVRQVVLALTQSMSQLALAKLCNISQPLISSIVRGGKKLGKRKCAEFGLWYTNYIRSAEAQQASLISEGGGTSGGSRLVFDKTREIPQLKSWFATNSKPSDEMLEYYSQLLNENPMRKDSNRTQVTAKALRNWWKNERQKLGIRQREIRSSPKQK